MKDMGKGDAGIWILLAVYLVCMLVLFRPMLHGADPYGYYSWIHSLVIDGDLDTTNDFIEPVCNSDAHVCYQANPYGVGTSVLWAPFFLLAHAIAYLTGLPHDGYSAPYVILCAFGSSLYCMAGLILAWDLARRLSTPGLATLATLTIWLASPLIFYMFLNGLLSHAVDVFSNALFIYIFYTTRDRASWRTWFVYGLLIGLAMLVRLPNVFLAIMPLVNSFAQLWRNRNLFRQAVIQYSFLGAGLLPVFFPQMVVWKITRNAWFLPNPYAGATGDMTDFLHPHLFEVFFSSDRGMLLWAPAVLLAVAVLPLLAGKLGLFGRSLAILFLLHLYLNASWSAWSGAVSFGPRLFLNCVPVFILSLSALIDVVRTRVDIKFLAGMATLLILWNILLMGQYVLEIVPRSGPVPVAELVRNQFTLIPNNITRLIRAVSGNHL